MQNINNFASKPYVNGLLNKISSRIEEIIARRKIRSIAGAYFGGWFGMSYGIKNGAENEKKNSVQNKILGAIAGGSTCGPIGVLFGTLIGFTAPTSIPLCGGAYFYHSYKLLEENKK